MLDFNDRNYERNMNTLVLRGHHDLFCNDVRLVVFGVLHNGCQMVEDLVPQDRRHEVQMEKVDTDIRVLPSCAKFSNKAPCRS